MARSSDVESPGLSAADPNAPSAAKAAAGRCSSILAHARVSCSRGLTTTICGGSLETSAKNVDICECSTSSTPDRKSTRLNSSHTVSSYAVFCLKKKKKTHAADRRREKMKEKTHQTARAPHT